jgi:hypothetical protein
MSFSAIDPSRVFPKRSLTVPPPLTPNSFFGGVPILPESAGYGIVLGFGIFFSIFTTTLVRFGARHQRDRPRLLVKIPVDRSVK